MMEYLLEESPGSGRDCGYGSSSGNRLRFGGARGMGWGGRSILVGKAGGQVLGGPH